MENDGRPKAEEVEFTFDIQPKLHKILKASVQAHIDSQSTEAHCAQTKVHDLEPALVQAAKAGLAAAREGRCTLCGIPCSGDGEKLLNELRRRWEEYCPNGHMFHSWPA